MSVEVTPVENLTVEDCKRELAGERDLNRLRSLVAASRLLHKMHIRRVTGKLEMNVQQGTVKRVVIPDYVDVT